MLRIRNDQNHKGYLLGSFIMFTSLYAAYGTLANATPPITNTATTGAITIAPADATEPTTKPSETATVKKSRCEITCKSPSSYTTK